MSKHIKVTQDGAVLCITIDRPDKKNALTGAMYEAMIEAFESAESDDSIGVIFICGSEGNFTAGGDINDFLMRAQSSGEFPALKFIRKLAVCDTPIVAAVEGNAVGIGTTMLFHCDLVYAATDTRFQMPFINLALVPEAASSLLVPANIGMRKASEYLLLAEAFGPQEAAAMGMINAMVADGSVREHALEKARQLAQKPRNAVRTARKLMRGDRKDVMARLEAEAKAFEAALRSDETRAIFEAFLARKK